MNGDKTKTNWVTEAKNIDDQYTKKSELAWMPFIVNFVRNDLQYRQKLVLNYIGDVNGKRIQDIGCGVGRISNLLEEKGASITGFDISSEVIDLANKYANQLEVSSKCKFEVKDICNHEFDVKKYGIWIALGVW